MKKQFFKFFAVIMSIAILITSLPLTAFSFDFSAESTESNLTSTEETQAEEKDIIELTERRTSDTKYFRLEDGSYYVAQYDTDVHYLDDTGNWQNIDNTLTESGSEISTKNAKIKFAKKTTGNESLFTLHDGNRKLTLSLNGANKKVEGIITNNSETVDESATKLQKMTTLSGISASVRYEDILDGTDLEYVINGSNIKEYIIVKEKSDSYTYSFTLSLNNLTAVLDDDGEVIVSDPSSGEAIYIIPAPYMWDADGNLSNAVSMTLESSSNGKYTLTVTADSSWINEEGRVFPVTIDPPIYQASSLSASTDIHFNITNGTKYNDQSLRIGNNYRAYWKLDTLPELPDSAYIIEATFNATSFAENTSSFFEGYVGVYDVLNAWDSSLGWNDITSTTSPKGTVAENYTDLQPMFYTEDGGLQNENPTWVITPIVKKWYGGQNYGLALAPVNDSFYGEATIRSNNYTGNTYEAPVACITYRDMKGLEDYWTFSSQSAGFAGTGHVNHATGNLVFEIPTLTTTDAIMPFTPTLVYNSALAGQTYTYPNAQTGYNTAFLGNGFKLNTQETLIEKSYIDENGIAQSWFIWADSDGTEHYFTYSKPGNDTENIYKDEDGLRLELHDYTESEDRITITDINNNTRSFSNFSTTPSGSESAWYLTSIKDKIGNTLQINCDTSGKPLSIQFKPLYSGNITHLSFVYSGNTLCAVYNPTSKEGVVFRYSNTVGGSINTSAKAYLRQVVRVHKATENAVPTSADYLAFYTQNGNASTSTLSCAAVADYSYDSNGHLTYVTNNMSQYQLEYTYSSNRVSSVYEYSTAMTYAEGQSIYFTYNTSSTVLRTSGTDDEIYTSDDLLTTYVFDGSGRSVSCYTTDVNKTQVYGVSSGQYNDDGTEATENSKNNLKSSVQTTQQSSNYLLNGDFENSGFLYWNTSGNVTPSYMLQEAGGHAAKFNLGTTQSSATLYQYVYLDKGEYTLSLDLDTVKAENVTIQIKAESMVNSAHSVTDTISIDKNDAAGKAEFAGLNFTATPTTTGGTERFKISIVVSGTFTTGSCVWVDKVMLSKTTGAIEYDMVNAGHFEGTLYDPSNFWSILGEEDTPITTVDSGTPALGDVLKVDKEFEETALIQQVVYQASDDAVDEYLSNGYADPSSYTLFAWGKGTCQSYSESAHFKIRVFVDYYDGDRETFNFEFDKGTTDWQFISGSFETDISKGLVDTITLMIMYNDHPGVGYFDNISLIKDSNTATSSWYDARGNMIASKSGRQAEVYSYDERDNLIKTVSSKRWLTEYTYDSDDQLTEEIHKKYMGYVIPSIGGYYIEDGSETEFYRIEYSYNTYGLPTESVTYDCSNESNVTRNYTEYYIDSGSHIFGATKSVTNEAQEKTLYFYDASNARLMAVIYPDGNGICYAYDDIGNMTDVLPAQTSGSGYSDVANSASVNYGYDSVTNRLNTITTGSTVYTFTYDVFGNTESIKAGDNTLVSYTYHQFYDDMDDSIYSGNGKLETMTYGNGLSVKYVYDVLDRIEKIQYNIGSGSAFETVYEYEYDAGGRLSSVTDHRNEEITVYKYDSSGKLIKYFTYDSSTNANQYGAVLDYDDQSRISRAEYSLDYENSSGSISQENIVYYYTYDQITGNLSTLLIAKGKLTYAIMPVYDRLGRTTSRVLDFSVDDSTASSNTDVFYNKLTYDYKSVNGYETGLVSQLKSEIRLDSTTSLIASTTYNYTYDQNGNITKITDASGVIQYQYAYDALGQLVREDNKPLNKTYVYVYDNAGNITAKKIYAFTTGTLGTLQSTQNYTYSSSDWGDMLTSFRYENVLSYDAIGNPTNVFDGSLGYELEWEGRQLKTYRAYEYDIDTVLYFDTITYTYNADGIRTSKTVNGVKHEYLLDGAQIVSETWTRAGADHLLVYLYDETGAPVGLKYRTNAYAEGVYDSFFFDKNLQGDIVAVYNSSGEVIGTYTYDAWGACTVWYSDSTTLLEAQIVYNYNPFRYRGYFYDRETNLYYLQTRYYNPSWCRFINADGELSRIGGDLRGYNLYSYCMNNPVNMIDPAGNWPKWLSGALNIVSGIVQMTAGVALGTFASWTGVGAVAAGTLVVNGISTAAQGVGQIVNDVTDSYVFREDNIVRTGVQELGRTIAGETGAKIAGGAYDVAVIAASVYVGRIVLEKHMPEIIESRIFSAHDGYGFKVGKNIEMFYRNPNAAGGPGGTFFSYKGSLGKFRFDWDPTHGFHFHPPGHK